MDPEKLKIQIHRDLNPVSSVVLGVYLFGSQVRGQADEKSDIDICLVAGPDSDPVEIQFLAWKKICSELYDIRIF